ncbi:argininosuccinate lyase [Anaeromyxobacter paludicola]|uniref:Argininosuccinate lyase n=1 Tax=Anaeromyxobacter paludicola TaxID=2918171 RepID=A0ABN6N876_9BACT|nr:argininosuccinate lyase [Anaeromyxobacter paludicola]BDG09407.1 argininosuccinate lyase [Anaeromyxobacter paludicola]
MNAKTKAKPISRAALSGEADPRLVALSVSIQDDGALYEEDIRGSQAHVSMLAAQGIVPKAAARRIVAALDQVCDEFAAGKIAFDPSLEDVHTHVERRLGELVGKDAGYLHAGRSRNDQVALDERLFIVRGCDRCDGALVRLMQALLAQAKAHEKTLLPGYTHLQRAQPVSLAHHLLAYVEMLGRDRERFAEVRRRAAVSPLGSGALAGTTLPLDRERTARALGLAGVTQNSLDAVSDRDSAIELSFACALASVHLSRLGEEVVLWTTREFGFMTLDDAFATGSSLMPQKKNSDVAELSRGRAARAIGDLVSLLAMVKNLPLAYNRDLQEDKRPLLDGPRALVLTLDALAGAVETATFHAEVMRAALGDGEALATDAAEYLVEKGVPFREAHEAVGKAAAFSTRAGRPLARLTAAEWASFHPRFGADVLRRFDPAESLRRRELPGAPGPKQVKAQLARWSKALRGGR